MEKLRCPLCNVETDQTEDNQMECKSCKSVYHKAYLMGYYDGYKQSMDNLCSCNIHSIYSVGE
jgi:hypothetical protein